jgi:hypothetical protein
MIKQTSIATVPSATYENDGPEKEGGNIVVCIWGQVIVYNGE